MRWKSGRPKYVGEIRVITEFLWFPRKINHEWRWLETAKIRQISEWSYNSGVKRMHWYDDEWVDDEKEEVK
ncbi:hypothetical protein [Bacillus phage vB_BanS-Thrax1]|nr:hypothetical protein [Bacillus phage vB_BanS-Thrax1]